MTRANRFAARLTVAGAWICLTLVVSATRMDWQRVANSDGWQIPADAATEQNPQPNSPAVIEQGRKLYRSKCARCHGADGTGRGPDGDPDHPPSDLSDGRRASRNPDGVLFYKIWNGRAKPRMPAMKTDLTPADVWMLVHYVKTLRR